MSLQGWGILDKKHGPSRAQAIKAYLKKHNIQYLLISPRYYRGLTDDRTVFEPIKEWHARYPIKRLMSPQTLYRLHWNHEETTSS